MTIRFHAAPIAGALLTSLVISTSALAGNACDCVCKPVARHAPARMSSDAGAEYAQSYYDYRSASAVREVTVISQAQPWVEAPHDGNIGGYQDGSYGGGYGGQQVLGRVDANCGGGVGYNQADQGYMDSYGQVHFATAGNGQNGPTYNTYDQSFSNMPGPQGGYGPTRFNPWHGYNFQNGPSNGY